MLGSECPAPLARKTVADHALAHLVAFLTDWKQLAACRVLLGLLEAGFFPGCVYLIQCWYTRFETQKR